jgi:hypothetical protein
MTIVTWFKVVGSTGFLKPGRLLTTVSFRSGGGSQLPVLEFAGAGPGLHQVVVGAKTKVAVDAPGFKAKTVDTGTNQAGDREVPRVVVHVTLDPD